VVLAVRAPTVSLRPTAIRLELALLKRNLDNPAKMTTNVLLEPIAKDLKINKCAFLTQTQGRPATTMIPQLWDIADLGSHVIFLVRLQSELAWKAN